MGFAAQSAMFLNAHHATLHLPHAQPPACETSGTMCAARNATSQNVLHVPLLLRPPALPSASGTSGTTSAVQSATFLNVLPATRPLLLLLRQHLHHLQHAPRPVSGTSGTMCAALSATFLSARPVFLLLLLLPNKSRPPAPQPA